MGKSVEKVCCGQTAEREVYHGAVLRGVSLELMRTMLSDRHELSAVA